MISNFFYKLLKTKPPNWGGDPNKEQLLYLMKYYSAKGYFCLSGKFYNFIGRITKYYPFSLLFQNRLFHYQNIPYRNFMERLEKIGDKSNIRIFIHSGQGEGQITEFYGKFLGRPKDKDRLLMNLEQALRNEFGTIYVRVAKSKLRIIIPTKILNQYIYPN